MTAARRGYVDLILDPADTRKYLVDAFESLYIKCAGVPDKKHGTKSVSSTHLDVYKRQLYTRYMDLKKELYVKDSY